MKTKYLALLPVVTLRLCWLKQTLPSILDGSWVLPGINQAK
jgi:hypothetical protein